MKILTIKSSQGSLGKNDGCEHGPEAILDQLNLKAKDIPIDLDDIEKTHKNIERATKNFSGLIIGGDHSFTYSSVKSFIRDNPEGKLIMFDAHADCVNRFYPPSHEDFVRSLIEDGIIKPENVTIIGTRNVDPVEIVFLNVQPINHFTMEELNKVNEHLKTIKGPYYVSIDIDVLDSTIAPGTGYPEEEGMNLEELQKYLELLPNPQITDLVEVNPLKDVDNTTVETAATIIKKYLKI